MRSHTRLFLALTVAALLGHGSGAAAQGSGSMPPLIDRELFFGDPELAGAQISPDGRFIAFMRPFKGTRNIWVKATGEPFDRARPVTADTTRPVPGFFWSRDGRFILFVQDQGGDENYNVYAVDPSAKPAAGADVPAARNLTAAKGARAVIYNVPRKDPDMLHVGLNDRDPAWHDLYRVRLSTGERTLLRQNTDRIVNWVFDLEDELRLAARAAENGDTEILRVAGGGFAPLYSCNVFETCSAVRFHRDGRRVYTVTNRGAEVDLVRLVLLDVTSGSEELVESDPRQRVDLIAPLFSDRTGALIGTVYIDERVRIHWRDKAFEADYQFLRKELGDGDLSLASSTTDERLWIVNIRSDVDPGATYLYDRDAKRTTLQYRLREKLNREHLAPMTHITYPSSDGVEIPAYLTLPVGVATRNLPLVVFPHGGPWARDVWGYSSYPQFLANRGYAVLQPNFRGSTGYGQTFLDAGNGEWGDKMQDDITWGVRHLVGNGTVDPKRVAIMGISYGGYATLAGLAFTPDLYAAGVSIVGPSNLITLLDSIPPYWEAVRTMFHRRMGDPAVPAERQRLERQSPLNSADRIRAALLVAQGANDPRVKRAESDQIVIALRDRRFPVEYLVAPDEGHGFARPVNNMAMMAAAEAFLARHVGGRYQKEMPPEVATRLAEIRVDPKTVEMPRAITTSDAATPTPAAPLETGTASYRATISLGGKSMEMAMTSEVVEEGDVWVITETAQTPMGPATDRTVVDRRTLVLRSRSITQGPLSVELQVKDGKAIGEMKMAGQQRPIAVELDGELFGDGAGAHRVLATLPLADGYTTTYRNLDVQNARVKPLRLQVAGSEQITVPAGNFDAWKIAIESPDDGARTTLWVDRASRKVVRVEATAPHMGGATITSELQE